MLLGRTRVLLAGAALILSSVFPGPATLAQEADPQAQLDTINAQKDVWQQRLDQARGQISRSNQSLASAKAKLNATKTSLARAKAQAATLQANNPAQINQLKQELTAA